MTVYRFYVNLMSQRLMFEGTLLITLIMYSFFLREVHSSNYKLAAVMRNPPLEANEFNRLITCITSVSSV